MAITFRDLKDAALSHVEMDTNLASYYLSSSVSGRTITFYKSGSDGNVISSSLELSDSDNQTLTITGDQLSITNGNTVTVPTGSNTAYTAGDHLELDGTTFNNIAPDQIVSLTGQGATTVTGTYPDFIISSSDNDTTYSKLSEFTNDVGYITSSTNTTYSAGVGLTLLGTEFSLTEPHFSGDYEDLTSKPTIPTIPTNVSAFTNDVGYITSSLGTLYTAGTGLTLTGAEFSLTDPHFDGDYNSLTNKPTVGLSLVTNNLTLTKLDGTTDIIDLTPYLDEDARAIASGILDGVTGIVTFTRDDTTTFTLDLSDLLDGSGLVTSVNGFDGIVALTTDHIPEGSGSFYDKTVVLTGAGATTITGTYPSFTISSTDTNTQLSDADIAAFGYIKTYTDTNTQLTDADIAAFGYIKTYTDTDTTYTAGTGLTLTGTVFSNDITNNNQLTNGAGYITGYTETDTLASVVARGSTTPNSITAANFITTSDRRLKSDIEPLKDGLDTIKKFVSYEYTKGGVQDAGFMAQEVQEAIPYAIAEGEDGFLTMRDRPVLAYMHKAILELEARLAAIEEKLN